MLDTPDSFSDWIVIILILMLIALLIAFGFMCVLLCKRLVQFNCFALYQTFTDNRYQHRTVGMLRRKIIAGPDLPLNRLPVNSTNMLTEYNPNYEFAGVTYTLKDLKDIPRNQLQLQKYRFFNIH